MRLRLILLITLLTASLMGEEKTDAMLFGHVTSKESGEHIPYASIMVKGTTLGTAADGTGHFKMTDLPVGKCLIVAKAMGYKSQTIEVVMEKSVGKELYFELEEDVINSEEIVVTGTRTEHYVKDAPVRTEVITSRELENKNAVNLYEALENTPGIRVEQQCQYCNFSMVRMQGLGAEHTQVLIDGQPIYSGLAGIYGLDQVSMTDVDRIEIVKGAGSAIYGSGAVAGALNIVTKKPSYVPSTNFDLQFGSHNTNRYQIYSTIRNEKGNMGMNVFALKSVGDAIDETGPGTDEDEVDHEDGISDRVEYDLNNMGLGFFAEGLLLRGDALEIKGKSIFEKREGGTMDDDYYKNPLTDGTENITTKRYEAELKYKFNLFNGYEFNFTGAYSYHDRNATNDSYLGDYMATHDDEVPDLRNMRPYLAEEHSVSNSLTIGKTAASHNLLLGLQFYYSGLDESGMYVVVDEASQYFGKSYESNSEKFAREFGVFLQDEWEIMNNLVVVPGVRWDHHYSEEEYTASKKVFESDRFPKTDFDENSVNPRLAIKYTLSDRITLRLNGGTGYRAPYGFSEDLHLCSGSPRVWKSNSLDPEKSVSVNFSADYYGARSRISLNVFRTDLKDKIGFVDASDAVASRGYDYQWMNIDDAYVQGVEVSFMTRLYRNLDLGVDFTVNEGEYDNAREDWVGTKYEDDSKKVSRFPSTTGSVKLEYSDRSWEASVSGHLKGEMYIDYYNEEIDPQLGDQTKIAKTDPFVLINLKAAKKFGQFKIYGGVNNLLNYIQEEKYLDDAAFMYGPMYGAMYYAGLKIMINH